MTKRLFFLISSIFVISFSLTAQLSITNTATPYLQNFNTLASTGTASTVPSGWEFIETGTGANTTYLADNGTVNSGNTYSFGATSAADRAFGSLQSGSVTPTIGVRFFNNSGTTITSLNIIYTGEQWRIGTLGRVDRLDFQYSTDATSLTGTGTWTDEDNLDFTSPINSGTIGALDGNAAPNKTAITYTISGLNIASGSSFWLRWNDFSASGADDGLGIDDLTINFNGAVVATCTEPANAPTVLGFTPASSTIYGSFTAASPAVDEYLVVRSASNSLAATPLDGTVYSIGQSLGGGTVIAEGSATNFTDIGLTPNSTYYYFVFSLNSDGCTGGPNYLTTSLNGNAATLPLAACVAPVVAPTVLTLSPSNNTVLGSFTVASGVNRYLVIRSTSSTLSVASVNGATYTTNQILGNGIVVSYSSSNSFAASSLTANTLYYFFVFSANGDCSGEPFYNTISLKGSTTTTNTTTGIPAGYYDAAAGLTCEPLKTALFNIISANTVQLTYTPGLWDAYLKTDLHRNDANTADIIWDIYTDNPTGPETITFNPATNKCGNYSKEGDCYNREHSFPQAWFGAGKYPMYSDLHHVFPVDGWDNGKHDNNPYSEVGTATFSTANGSKLGNNIFPGFTGTVFEPIDAYKGDIARAQLYMITRYQDSMMAWQNNANADDILNGTTYPSLDAWYIKLLFKWHQLDPVSQKEINRNDSIYVLQRNRNPFVDHPEYVALMFECTGLLPVNIIEFKAVKGSNFVNLIWTATRETNFKNYEIERSADGFHFEKTGTVAGQNLTNYAFTDDKLPNVKQVFYRLKMIDIDGKFTYSKTASIRLNNNFSNAVIYPNPTNGPLTILLEKALISNSTLVVSDITGRKLLEQNASALQNAIAIDVHHLPAGRYFVTIKNNNQLIKEAFVIIK
ncbi:MAG: endonuclease [Ferruginibacter sp.]